MAKKHKHEEHVNHERWVISFADMMTLLFALFVVLYAMGVQDLEKLKKLKESIQFAFHIEGEGKTKDEGIFDKQADGGQVPEAAPLVNPQEGAMRQFLQDLLQEEHKEIDGRSLDIVMTDDTITVRTALSSFFELGRPHPVKPKVHRWLMRAAEGSLTFTSDIRIIIEAEEVVLGKDSSGRAVTSLDLCDRRLWTIRRTILGLPEVKPHTVRIELREKPMNTKPTVKGWEDRAEVIVAFSNMRAENR